MHHFLLLVLIVAAAHAAPSIAPNRDLLIEAPLSHVHPWTPLYMRSQGAGDESEHSDGGQRPNSNRPNRTQRPNGPRRFIVMVEFTGAAGDTQDGLLPVHDPPVPIRVHARVDAHLFRIYGYGERSIDCDVRFPNGVAYMLRDVEAGFTFRFQWDGERDWENVELLRGQ
ncbi:hypothetical protein F5876DRAFT_73990 [Lentinula aff. lateritia]|uniref:Uncharacterized protein n=1 Tax=Lentinula aff. lateritia TaxID=2804960 RepID=A0ACC1U9S9_9AGAR|nr:hypothetical protein F5876DRAFT_73990 [Lentinula aff. lateritia]